MRSNAWMLGFVLAVSLSSPVASAAEISIFGLELGKPFDLKECAFKKVTKTLSFYEATTDTVCYKRVSNDEAGRGISPADDKVFIEWPRGQEPEIASFGTLSVWIIEGNLESVRFGTQGVISQARDMKALTDKFGPPTTGLTPVAQNGYGATSQTIRADWRSDGVSVYYNSAENSFSSGFVRIQTAKGAAAYDAFLEKLKGSRQKP